jgi:ParB family chromosome partitioning protein
MPKQRFGLGRGLDALIPSGSSLPGVSAISDDVAMDTSLSNSSLFEVPVTAIAPNPKQPRMPLGDDEDLRELADSIHEHGLLQPLLVTLEPGANTIERDEGPIYTLIAGERRWRAARIAGLDKVPVVIRDATPQLMLEMALVENLQRTDLNPLEEAEGYRMLIEEYHLTQDQVAERVGRNRTTIANSIRLLQLPAEVREALVKLPKVFTEGHARAVLSITGEAERINATRQIIAQRMSVRAAEELARRYNEAALRLTPDRRGARVTQQSYETRALEEEFTRAIELKARLQRNTKGKGSLTLYFTNEEQLQALYDRIVLHGVADERPILAGDNGDGALGYGMGDSGVDSLLDEAFDITFDGGEEPDSDN